MHSIFYTKVSVNLEYATELTEIPSIGKFFNVKIVEYKLKYDLL